MRPWLTDDSDADEACALGPLQSAACTHSIAFDPRAEQKVLTVQGVMPRDADFNQPLWADMQGFSLRPQCAAGRMTARHWSNCAAASPAQLWPTSAYKPAPPARWCSSAVTLARRHHAFGAVAAGVHAAAGCGGAQTEAASDPLWCPHNFVARSERTPASRAWRFGTQRQAARAGGAARARACCPRRTTCPSSWGATLQGKVHSKILASASPVILRAWRQNRRCRDRREEAPKFAVRGWARHR